LVVVTIASPEYDNIQLLCSRHKKAIADSKRAKRHFVPHAREEFYRLFLLHVEDDTANNSPGLEAIVHVLEVSQGLLFEGDLDLATSSDIDGLNGILAVSDVGTDDANALEDGEEDGCLEFSRSGQADGHKGSAGAEVVDGLGVTRGASSSDDCGVSTQSTGDALYVANEVLSLLEVYPSLGAEAENKLLLIFAGIDSDNTQTPGNGVLDSKVPESSTSAWENDPVTLLGLGVLDGTVDGNSGTED